MQPEKIFATHPVFVSRIALAQLTPGMARTSVSAWRGTNTMPYMVCASYYNN